tara:strand:- start:111 stop:308 length:198 start_codon:yes stop_codon:yes gene_type:complete
MDSSEKDDRDGYEQDTDESKERSKEITYDPKLDQWDEWYDDCEIQNKNSKIRRSKRRLDKQRDEW